MTVLFVVPYAPSRVRTRPFHLIKTLTERGHRVVLATLWESEAERRLLRAILPGVATIVGERMSTWRSVWNSARAVPTGNPLQSSFSWHAGLAARLTDIVRQQAIDVVHVEHLRGAQYGTLLARFLSERRSPRPAIVWDSVDCISDLFRYAATRGPRPAVRWIARLELPRTERYEGATVPTFARVLVTAAGDRLSLLNLAARRGCHDARLADRIVVLPNGVDLERFVPRPGPREEATLVMSGKMSYHANTVAVLRFAEEALPRIQARRPEVRLIVVGQDPPRAVRRLAARPGISITGTVEDVRPFLQRATIAIAPIEYAVGVQNKVLEALACGTPVVATAAAIRGLAVKPGRDLAVADGPDDFADTVLRLLASREERDRLSSAGRGYVETHHRWQTIAQQLEQVYRDAAA